MTAERQGWGEDAMRGVRETALSWGRARALYLDNAEEVWLDGGGGLSFGGLLGGTDFGCIAREERDHREAQPLGGWEHPAIRWTFHS
jgi:photosystem II stability/assembly factor-like uncharacterized protein